MHDGQNLFDPEDAFGGVAWAIDETPQMLILEGRIEPLIIVGIYNSGGDRINEYTPVRTETGKMKGHGGRAADYGRMIIEELKPFIDASINTARAGIYRHGRIVAWRACHALFRADAAGCV